MHSELGICGEPLTVRAVRTELCTGEVAMSFRENLIIDYRGRQDLAAP